MAANTLAQRVTENTQQVKLYSSGWKDINPNQESIDVSANPCGGHITVVFKTLLSG